MLFYYVLIAITYVLIFLYCIYVPLPDEIDPYRPVMFMEHLMRVAHEYPANVLERMCGPVVRNRYTRWCVDFMATLSNPKKPPAHVRKVYTEKMCNVPVQIYLPTEHKDHAAVFYIHGGGFCVMTPKNYDRLIYSIMRRLCAPVFAIDYRLAPEHPFPAAVEDCEAVAAELLTKRCKEFDINPDKFIIMGDSAGGNLSAITTQRLRKRKINNFKVQVLLYPVIQASDMRLPSYQLYNRRYPHTSLLSPTQMIRWFLLYFGLPAHRENVAKMMENEHVMNTERQKDGIRKRTMSHRTLPPSMREAINYSPPDIPKGDQTLASEIAPFLDHPDFSPIVADTLEGLPAAMVVTCGWDILRDEGVLYAKKLETDGVPMVWQHYPNAVHGALLIPGTLRNRMLHDIVEFIQGHL